VNVGLSAISLFSGAGGLDLAARWAGIRTVCYVENDAYAQAVLMSRMRDSGLHEAPIWDDVRTFNGDVWRHRVDVVFGGFPCQDLSVAGRQAGIIDGQKSGLWRDFARIIREVGPRFVLVENVPGILMGGALGVVLGDLAEMGFDARWEVRGACEHGAPHTRERMFLVAYPNGFPLRIESKSGWFAAAIDRSNGIPGQMAGWGDRRQRPIAPGIPRVGHGMAHGSHRLRCCGNGVVPKQAFPAFEKVKELAGLK
jgi:DNA (cytosine-5)-methyltransferase 1